MAGNDFVDLTPQGNEKKREVRLIPEDLKIINDNPGGLTKEGCMHKVWLWAQSNNFHQLVRYLAMYKISKNFAKSGKTEDGKIILSRMIHTSKYGVIKKWIVSEDIGGKNELGETIVMESVEKLEEFVKEKIPNINFITTKGST